MTETLALIPARGGSKGIPRKNIRSFAGYPLTAQGITTYLGSLACSFRLYRAIAYREF